MISQQGINITVHTGAGMADFECFQFESSTRGQEVIRGEHHASICLRLQVTSAFQWHDADLLLLQVRFGTVEALLPRRIFKPADGEELEIDFESLKVWNRETYEWREAEFQFCDLEYIEGMGAPWSEARRSNFGTITVTAQRMTHGEKDVKYQWPSVTFEPTMKVCSGDPIPPGIAHTIRISNSSKVERINNFDWGSVTRLEGTVGNCFTFRFLYRSERWLKTLSKEPLYPSNYLSAGIDATQTTRNEVDSMGGHTTEALGRGFRRKSQVKNKDNYIVKSTVSTKNNEARANQQPIKMAKKSNQTPSNAGLEDSSAQKRKSETVASSSIGVDEQEQPSCIRLATPTTSTERMSGPPTASLPPPLDESRAAKIRKLKEEEEILESKIIERLEARQAKVRRELEELEALDE